MPPAVVILLKIIQLLVSVTLIGIVAIQTTKNEGLSGSIGGQVTPTFKGKPGVDEQMRGITIKLSIAWFVISIIVATVTAHT